MSADEPGAEAHGASVWVRGFVAAAAVAALAWWIDLGSLAARFGELNAAPLALAVGLAALARAVRAWRWNRLLAARGVFLSQWSTLRLSLAAHFVGGFTPGQLGGDAYRVLVLRDHGRGRVLSSVLAERIVGLGTLAGLCLVMLPWALPALRGAAAGILAGFAVVLVVLALLLRAFERVGAASEPTHTARGVEAGARVRLADGLRQALDALGDYAREPRTLAIVVGATLAELALLFGCHFQVARALSLDLSWLFFAVAMPFVHLVIRVPISLQAVGVQEGAFIVALASVGVAPADGLAVALLQRGVDWLVLFLPGAWLWVGARERSRA